MKRRTGPRILTGVAVVTMVVAVIGFVATLALNAFVFDEYDAYGEVPIPPLKYGIVAPDGVAEPQLTEDYGSTTTINNDARVRIGYLHVPVEGDYEIRTNGNVSAYLNPRLALGHGTSCGHVPIIFAVVFAATLTPTDRGVRIEQLNTPARLRDSGALTELEFQAEKKRVLE